jgi:hypothetical protein
MRRLMRKFVLTTLLLLILTRAFPQSTLLDDFEDISGWKPIPSDGVRMNLSQGPGTTREALVMDFEFYAGSGYAIAQKKFPLHLPKNYKFTFFLKGETPVNNFEFKLLDSLDNVFWIKKLNITYPREWTKQTIRKRHLTFAWGPSGGGEIRKVDRIEFVVSAGTGGKGHIAIDDFRLETLPDTIPAGIVPRAEASSAEIQDSPHISSDGDSLGRWKSTGMSDREWLMVDFGRMKEFGGFVIDWDKDDYATAYDVLVSDDAKDWTVASRVEHGNGGRDYVPISDAESKYVKLDFQKSSRGKGYGLVRAEIKSPQFSSSLNDLFTAIAKDAPRGCYPKYFSGEQSYWTVIGTDGDDKEALINEQGAIEVDKLAFSLEPFLFVGGRLVTWNDASMKQSLEKEYLPVPSVHWNYKGWELHTQAFSAGVAGKSMLLVSYRLENRNCQTHKGKLFIALRPFQVNPPWQWLNIQGGVSQIDSIWNESGLLHVDGRKVIPMETPNAFGATTFESGDIVEYLRGGRVPPSQSVVDTRSLASAALEYDFNLPCGKTMEVHLAVPFHGWKGSPAPGMTSEAGLLYVDMAQASTVQAWETKLNHVQLQLPASAGPIANTLKSTLAYILINRDGPGIQPGSRSYERSWIRDGSLTSTALLQMSHREEVRRFIDWYAQHQYANGKIPCVVDARGADPVPEHDSHGEFIYAVLQYFRYSKDTTWLRSMFPHVANTVHYLQSLRAERKTDIYKDGSPEQRACYGLVPESISHEGYSDKARHSYWDDFFVMRGLKDATSIAGILGEGELQAEWRAERDDFKNDLYASLRLTMETKKIDYIPGCVELGDFDATSTAISVMPCGELGNLPELQLRSTFERYYRSFRDRENGTLEWTNYTPYELRIIGALVYMGQKERAYDLLKYFMKDRRPPAWNDWAEVVWRDPATPRYIGDMPHTWVGSEFIRSLMSMFVLERESDSAHVLAAGIPDSWVQDPAGVKAQGLQTPYGRVDYQISKKGKVVTMEVSGTFDPAAHRLVVRCPLSIAPRGICIDGKISPSPGSGEAVIRRLPAKVVFSY